MTNSQRPPISQHCTHGSWQVAAVIDWMDALSGGGRTLSETWNDLSPAPPYVLAANQRALHLALSGRPTMLVHTQLTGFDLVRRLLLEADFPQPNYFAYACFLDSDFTRLTAVAKKMIDSPFHLWEPMEHQEEELYEWLALFCQETGVQTVVVDDPMMIRGMSRDREWVELAKHMNVEILLYRPIEASGSMGI